jgi:molybdate transport system substrate-binding protein
MRRLHRTALAQMRLRLLESAAGAVGRGGVMRARALLVAAVLALPGCGVSSGPDAGAASDGRLSGTLTVFAAASLTDVFTELGERLEAEHPGLEVRFNFAGSSGLATQLEQGAPVDVFASADEAQMDRVADVVGDPEPFAANELVLAVPADDPAGIDRQPGASGTPGLADLLEVDDVLAVCAPEVPCGAAAAQVLAAADLAEAPDTLEDDVRGVLTKVQLGEVDAGLVYRSDVSTADGGARALPFRESGAARNRYPVAALQDAPNPEAAAAFVDLVLSEDGQAALADAGFQQP